MFIANDFQNVWHFEKRDSNLVYSDFLYLHSWYYIIKTMADTCQETDKYLLAK